MGMLQRIFKQKPLSHEDKPVEEQQAPMADMSSGKNDKRCSPAASANLNSKPSSQQSSKNHRWQSWDYSDAMYETDRHPVCRNYSRKLSDLVPLEQGTQPAAPAGAATVSVSCKQQLMQADETVLPGSSVCPEIAATPGPAA